MPAPQGYQEVLDANGPTGRYFDPKTGNPYNPDAPSSTPTSSLEGFFSSLNVTPPTPEDEAKFRSQATSEAQGFVDAINTEFAGKISRENQEGNVRNAKTQGMNLYAGLMGSPTATANAADTRSYNDAQVKQIEAEKATRIQEVMARVNSRVDQEIQSRREEARGNRQIALNYLTQARAEAREDLTALAGSGVDLDKLRATPEYGKLIEQSGMAPIFFESLYNGAKSARERVEYSYHNIGNGKVLRTGKRGDGMAVNEQVFDYGVPEGYTLTAMADGTPVLFNKTTGEVKIPEGFTEGQFAKEDKITAYQKEQLAIDRERLSLERKRIDQAQESGELTTKQTSTAIQLSNSLKSHPAYTEMLDIQGGIQGVKAGLSQENGFGDVTAINAFQRMVDPGATVREGDVALLQSASGWLDKVLSDYPIERLRAGDKLPEAVRERMRKTAQDLYDVRMKNYNDTVGNQYHKLADGAGIAFEYIGTDFGSSNESPKNDQYASYRAQVQQGEILIERNGVVGAIPAKEFNAKTDKKL